MKQIKFKDATGLVRVYKELPYKDCPIVLRQIGDNYFEWLLIYKNRIYSSFWVMNPRKGKKTLSEGEKSKTMAILLSGAVATIDELRKENKEEEVKPPESLPN